MIHRRRGITRMRLAVLVIDAQKGWLNISDVLRRSVEDRMGKMREAFGVAPKDWRASDFHLSFRSGQGNSGEFRGIRSVARD
jgi:hypothetical protein